MYFNQKTYVFRFKNICFLFFFSEKNCLKTAKRLIYLPCINSKRLSSINSCKGFSSVLASCRLGLPLR